MLCYGRRPAPPLPRHLHSHFTGTWLDALMDLVDAAAGGSADGCPATVGWLSPYRNPAFGSPTRASKSTSPCPTHDVPC